MCFQKLKGEETETSWGMESGCLDHPRAPVFLGGAVPVRSKNPERGGVRQLILKFILELPDFLMFIA